MSIPSLARMTCRLPAVTIGRLESCRCDLEVPAAALDPVRQSRRGAVRTVRLQRDRGL